MNVLHSSKLKHYLYYLHFPYVQFFHGLFSAGNSTANPDLLNYKTWVYGLHMPNVRKNGYSNSIRTSCLSQHEQILSLLCIIRHST